MAAFKDKKNGSWYVQFRYTDWRGERQQKLKRGFSTKKEAQAWEREFLMQKQADVNMSFESFVSLGKAIWNDKNHICHYLCCCSILFIWSYRRKFRRNGDIL